MFTPRTIRRFLFSSVLACLPALSVVRHDAEARGVPEYRFHLALKRAEPGINDTVANNPRTIKLWFTESVTAADTRIRLTGSTDNVLPTGDVTVDAAPLSPAVATVPQTLAPGTYAVTWRAMADDGHPSGGSFSFTVRSAGVR